MIYAPLVMKCCRGNTQKPLSNPQQPICCWDFWILNDFVYFMPAWCLITHLRFGLCTRRIASVCLVLHRVVNSWPKPSPISGRWLIPAAGLGPQLRSRHIKTHSHCSSHWFCTTHFFQFNSPMTTGVLKWWMGWKQTSFYLGAGPCRKIIPVSVAPICHQYCLTFQKGRVCNSNVVKPIIWQ